MKHIKRNSLTLSLIFLFIPINIVAQPFVDINAGLIGLTVGSAAWGDYDNDGDLDIVINGYDGVEEYSIVYRNDNGNFVDINAGLIPAAYGSDVAWGDYDNDGDLDLLLVGRIDATNRISKIYRNDNGNFIDINAGLIGISGACVSWGDYDNDGDLDILMAGWHGSGRNTKIYRNDDGNFVDINAGLIGIDKGTVAWGDYDNDSDLDIVLTGLDDIPLWHAKIYRNDDGFFTDINANLEEVDGSPAAWGDYDSDGDLDIVLAGRTSYGVYSRIYRNDNGNFVDINANIPDVYESSSQWGDYDNDGDLDLLLCGYDYTTRYASIFRNDNGYFVDINAGLSGIQNRNGAVWGDYDADGDLDILLTGNNGGTTYITKIYRNENITTNTIPQSPSNLTVAQTDSNEVILSWNKAIDNETSQNGLTYNLRIGTIPGGIDISSPMADLNTGYRRVPILGNTNHDTTWTIKNLTEGTYYWSVQSIDNCFSGSVFAQEDSFQISSQTFQLSVSIQNGWNMVSVPGTNPDGMGVDTWWQDRDSLANVFLYSGGYQSTSTTTPGIGYWMKHSGAQTYNTGDEWPAEGIQIVTHNPIAATSGWNLIGGYEVSVATSGLTTIPPGLISGPVYAYSGGYYIPTNLEPGYGYWVKLSGDGDIILPNALAKGTEPAEWFKEDWGRIVMADATGKMFTLYAVNEGANLNQYEMPPLPPQGVFDIRYSSGRIAEDLNSGIQSIKMMGITYPLVITVENISITIKDELGEVISAKLNPGEEIKLNKISNDKLMVISGELIPPHEYSLDQNYPNPFNPSTIIKYSIPFTSKVTIKVFDVLGNEIETLINQEKPAGTYELTWYAEGLPSGVYFYRIQAGNYVDTKKMVLLK